MQQNLLTAAAVLISFGWPPVSAAQLTTYYCSLDGQPVSINGSDRDFRVDIRPMRSSPYASDTVCEFNVDIRDSSSNSGGSSGPYFVEIESFKVDKAILTVRSGSQVLFRSSSLQGHQSSLSTPSGQLSIRFEASNDKNSQLDGVKIRVRSFDNNGCPPNWAFLAGSCFGTSGTESSLDFFDAQKACNGVRSNLLQLPIAYFDRVADFARKLPTELRHGLAWVGLTDRTRAGQFRHFWLNGQRQQPTTEISCFRSAAHYTTCQSNERCGAFREGGRGIYAIYMDNCLDSKKFACSMPPGGASLYYSVPAGSSVLTGSSSSRRSAWMWGGLVVGLLLLFVAVLGVRSLLRSGGTRRAAAATDSSPVVCRYPEPPPLPPPSLMPPAQCSAAPPQLRCGNGGGCTSQGTPLVRDLTSKLSSPFAIPL